MDPEVIVVVVAAVLLGLVQLVRLKRTEALHRSLQEAIRTGSPELVDKLCLLAARDSQAAPMGPLLIGIAIALAGFGFIQGDAENIRNLGGLALFPAVTGVILVAWGRVTRDRPL